MRNHLAHPGNWNVSLLPEREGNGEECWETMLAEWGWDLMKRRNHCKPTGAQDRMQEREGGASHGGACDASPLLSGFPGHTPCWASPSPPLLLPFLSPPL